MKRFVTTILGLIIVIGALLASGAFAYPAADHDDVGGVEILFAVDTSSTSMDAFSLSQEIGNIMNFGNSGTDILLRSINWNGDGVNPCPINMSVAEYDGDNGSFTALVKDHEWQQARAMHVIVNLDGDGLPELETEEGFGGLVYLLNRDNVYYLGVGNYGETKHAAQTRELVDGLIMWGIDSNGYFETDLSNAHSCTDACLTAAERVSRYYEWTWCYKEAKPSAAFTRQEQSGNVSMAGIADSGGVDMLGRTFMLGTTTLPDFSGLSWGESIGQDFSVSMADGAHKLLHLSTTGNGGDSRHAIYYLSLDAAPIADFSLSDDVAYEGEQNTILLTDESYDPAGGIERLVVTIADEQGGIWFTQELSSGVGAQMELPCGNLEVGEYTVTLTVTGFSGKESKYSRSIYICHRDSNWGNVSLDFQLPAWEYDPFGTNVFPLYQVARTYFFASDEVIEAYRFVYLREDKSDKSFMTTSGWIPMEEHRNTSQVMEVLQTGAYDLVVQARMESGYLYEYHAGRFRSWLVDTQGFNTEIMFLSSEDNVLNANTPLTIQIEDQNCIRTVEVFVCDEFGNPTMGIFQNSYSEFTTEQVVPFSWWQLEDHFDQNGKLRLRVRVRDFNGIVSMSSHEDGIFYLDMDNTPPEVSGKGFSIENGFLHLDFNATDDGGIVSWEVQRNPTSNDWEWICIDGQEIQEDTSSLNISNMYYLGESIERIRLVVVDKAGNETSSGRPHGDVYEYFYDTSAPTNVSVSAPTGAFLTGTANIRVSYRDNVGVAQYKIEYSRDQTSWTTLCDKEAASQTYATEALDTAALSDGAIYLRVTVTDWAGNSTTSPVKSYLVDNTPPDAPGGFRLLATASYIYLYWETPQATDTDYFSVYRAIVTDGMPGEFTLMNQNYELLGWYNKATNEAGDKHKNLEPKTEYAYYVVAVDQAGNVGAATAVLRETLRDDEQDPWVHSIYPHDGAVIKKGTELNPSEIKASLVDDFRLASVVLYARKAGDERWEAVYTNTELSAATQSITVNNWEDSLASYTEGVYELYFEVTDFSGNESVPYEFTYTLDDTAPGEVTVQPINGGLSAGVSWEAPEDADLAGFKVYVSSSENGEYAYVGKLGANERSFTVSRTSGDWWFKVITYDHVGNESAGVITMANSRNTDEVAPNAVITAATAGVVGSEMNFSAAGSSDNVGIVEFKWDFGDGSAKKQGVYVKHTYAQPGNYTVKLTAVDGANLSAMTTHQITVYATGQKINLVVVVQDTDGKPVTGATVVVIDGGVELPPVLTDETGTANVAVDPTGEKDVFIYKDGAETSSYKVPGAQGGEEELQCDATLGNASYLAGVLSVRRLDIEEIVEAGIDITDTENQYIWEYEIEITVENPGTEGTKGYTQKIFVSVPTNYLESEPMDYSKVIWVDTGNYDTPSDDQQESETRVQYVFVPGAPGTPPSVAILKINGMAHWTKEFFEAELSLINYAPKGTDITMLTAQLNLPSSGLVLAPTAEKQSTTIDMGMIEGGGNTGTAKWILRGDMPGEYSLSATVTGSFDDGTQINKQFVSEDPIVINGAKDLKLYVKADDTAYKDVDYTIALTWVNDSSEPIYNLDFTMEGGFFTGNASYNASTTTVTFPTDTSVNISRIDPGYRVELLYTFRFKENQLKEGLSYYLKDHVCKGTGEQVTVIFDFVTATPPAEVVTKPGTILVYTIEDERSIPLSGVKLSTGDWSYTTGNDGIAETNVRVGYNKLVTIAKDGYVTKTMKYAFLKNYGIVYLAPEGSGEDDNTDPGGSTTQVGDTLNLSMPRLIAPPSLPLFANQSFNFSAAGVKIQYKTLDGGKKFIAMVGISGKPWEGKTDEGGIAEDFAKFKSYVDGLTSAAEKGYKEYMAAANRSTYWKPDKRTGNLFGKNLEVSVVGYIEGIIDENGRRYVSDSGIITTAELKIAKTHQLVFFAGPVPIPYVVPMGIEGKGEVKINVLSMEEDGKLNLKDHFSFEVKGNVGLGLGVANIATITGEVEAGGKIGYSFAESKFDWSLSTRLVLKGKFLMYTATVNSPLTTWKTGSDSVTQLSRMAGESDFTLMERSTQSSQFAANQPVLRLFSASDSLEKTAFATNVFEDPRPQLIDLGDGKQMLLWIDDVSTRDDYNRTALMYSVYNGTNWSAPVIADDDGTPDFVPTVLNSGDTVHIAWMNADRVITTDDGMMDLSQAMDISVVSYDIASGTLGTVKNVSKADDGIRMLDMMPALAVSGSELTVSWVSNSESEIFYGMSGDENACPIIGVMSATYANGTWSEAETRGEELPYITDLTSAYIDGVHTVVYTTGDAESLEDTAELFLLQDGDPVRVTDDEVIDASPVFSGGVLYWYRDAQLVSIGNFATMTIETLIGEDQGSLPSGAFRILEGANGQKAVLCEEIDESAARLMVSVYDTSSGTWGAFISVTEDDLSVSAANGFIAADGALKMVFAGETDSVSIYTASLTPAPKLSIDGQADFNAGELIPGETLEVGISVSNTGTLGIDGLKVELIDGSGQVIATVTVPAVIDAGSIEGFVVELPIPADWDGEDVTIRVSGEGTSGGAVSSNQLALALGAPDISVSKIELVEVDGAPALSVTLKNRGYTDAADIALALRYDAPDGDDVASAVVASLPVGEEVTQVIGFGGTTPDFTEQSARAAYIVAEPAPEETETANNSAFIALSADDFDDGGEDPGGGKDKDKGNSGNGGGSTVTPPVEIPDPDSPATGTSPFSDVAETHWALDYIVKAVEYGFVNGMPDGTFLPDQAITRAEFVKMLVSCFDLKVEEGMELIGFDDVPETHWAKTPIEISAVLALVKGVGGGKFEPDAYIARQDAALVLYRLQELLDVTLPDGEEVIFGDAQEIREDARQAVAALAQGGIISGKPGPVFDPQGTLTRAETAKLLVALFESISADTPEQ